ncbi:MAG: hypothetical protein LBQ91_04490 [Oscillospiraceae bacterium]|jgi:hypothetical protein|nr:hypothetical protein [Oscillospiraceae bacterium]
MKNEKQQKVYIFAQARGADAAFWRALLLRAALMLVIVGEESVFRQMAAAADERRRYCGLKEALPSAENGAYAAGRRPSAKQN